MKWPIGDRLLGSLSAILNVFVLLVAMLLAILATSELTGRMQALAAVNRREAQELANIVDGLHPYPARDDEDRGASSNDGAASQGAVRVRLSVSGRAPSGADTAVSGAAQDPDASTPARAEMRPLEPVEQLAFVRRRSGEARTLLETLSMRGGDVTSSNVVVALEHALSDPVRPVYGDAPLRRAVAGSYDAGSSSSSGGGGRSAVVHWTRNTRIDWDVAEPWGPLSDAGLAGGRGDSDWSFAAIAITSVAQSRNDFLLALTVIVCALIGSQVSSLRTGNTGFAPVSAAIGLGSGFIAFVSLRGGRGVFLMELGGDAPTFNAHGMAMVGILVGLFSARAYALLAMFVDDLHLRLTSAFVAADGRILKAGELSRHGNAQHADQQPAKHGLQTSPSLNVGPDTHAQVENENGVPRRSAGDPPGA